MPRSEYGATLLAWALIMFVAGFLVALLVFFHTPSINCPHEDSCYADYYNGQWHIVRGERP